MWLDIVLLASLETRRLKNNAAYWLRLLGFESGDSWLYRAYIVAFWSFWAFTIWAFVIEQVEHGSQQIATQDAAAFLDSFPALVLALQFLYFVSLLFDPPLKLLASDLSYTAASPVSRGAITLVHFVRVTLVPAFVLALAGVLAALFFAWSLSTANASMIGIRAFFLAFTLVYVSAALAWMAALSWRNGHKYIVLLAVLVSVFLYPGYALPPASIHIRGVVLLFVGGAAALVGLYIAGERTHMTRVMDSSQTYARIQKLGVWAAQDMVARIRKQARLARKRHLRKRLPETFNAHGTLFGQSSLVLTRLSPGLGLRLIAAGLAITSLSIVLVTVGGASSVQTWLLLLVFLIRFRPDDAVRLFSTQRQQPFLRQFLPENNLLLFASQTSLPLLLMGVGVGLAVFTQASLAALPLALGVLVALALSQALETVHSALPGFCYEYAVVACGVFIVGPGYLLHSVWAAFAAVVLVNFALALLLYHSTPAFS